MSQSLTGVTFLAFGNGSPDVFSTFAAMSSHSGSLAVGELIGAASFITAVVAGSMALVQPFEVAKHTFVRDVGFFVVAVSFSMIFLADGRLHLWECAVMVCSYAFYVAFVLVWHWWLGRRRRRKTHPGAEHISLGHGAADVADSDDGAFGDRGQAERLPLIQGHSLRDIADLENGAEDPDFKAAAADDDELRDASLAVLNRKMRVTRPSWGERRITTNPIRPSLLGALEFRATFSSQGKPQPGHGRPSDVRRFSYDPTYTVRRQSDLISVNSDPAIPLDSRTGRQADRRNSGPVSGDGHIRATAFAGNRARAVSESDVSGLRRHLNPSKTEDSPQTAPPDSMSNGGGIAELKKGRGCVTGPPSPRLSLSPPPSVHDIAVSRPASSDPPLPSPYLLAPPQEWHLGSAGYKRGTINTRIDESDITLARPDLPKILIPDPDDQHEIFAPPCSFPRFTESPSTASLQGLSPSPSIILSDSPFLVPPDDADHSTTAEHEAPRRLSYNMLTTLFPTLDSWNDKNVWERFVGLIAAPSVLLLTITLPVVEGPADNDGPRSSPPLSPVPRERSRSNAGNHWTLASGPSLLVTDDLGNSHGAISKGSLQDESTQPMLSEDRQLFDDDGVSTKPNATTEHIDFARSHLGPSEQQNPRYDLLQSSQPSDRLWNRWLVSIQIILAPLFVLSVIWANGAFDRASRSGIWWAWLATLVASLVVLVVFLYLTKSSRPPRFHFLLSFVGFVVGIAWISTVAGEVVGVLKAFGVILGISDAILGLTVFAVGNSLGDLVADITVARLGYQVMALSACFGGPMLNILLGIGIGGLYMMIRDGTHWHERHPNKRIRYRPYEIEVGNSLVISGVTLLVTLLGLLIWVPLNGWRMSRKIGWSLIGLWTLSTLSNVIVEVLSGGRSVSYRQ